MTEVPLYEGARRCQGFSQFYATSSTNQEKIYEHMVDSAATLWEGCRESRRCSRNTYPESYTTKCTSIRRQKAIPPPSEDG